MPDPICRTIPVVYRKTLSFGHFNSHTAEVTKTIIIERDEDFEPAYLKELARLQVIVDRGMQTVGFIPDDRFRYGQESPPAEPAPGPLPSDAWACTLPQRAMIENLVEQSKIPKKDVQRLAKKLFGLGVRQLDARQATDFFNELEKRHARTVPLYEASKDETLAGEKGDA